MAHKFTTVTDGNLHLIKHRFEQFVNRHPVIQNTWHYPTQARRNKKLSVDDRGVEKSMTTTSFRDEMKVTIQQIFPSDPRYIHVYFKRDEAGIIQVGDKIRINSTQVIHICRHPTIRHENAKIIFKPTNHLAR